MLGEELTLWSPVLEAAVEPAVPADSGRPGPAVAFWMASTTADMSS
jgi:hypothetical protein